MPLTPKVGFFNPVDTLSIGGDWEVQGDTNAENKQRAQGLNANGDEAASDLYGAKATVSNTFKCFASTGNLTLPKVGTVTASGHHIDSVSLNLAPTDWPELSVSAHKHTGTKNHAAGSCRTYTPSLTFAAGRGIPRAVGGFALGVGDTAIGIASVKYSMGVTHQDATENGDFLAGENRDGVEKFDITLTGTGATITAPANWDKLDNGSSRSNTGEDSETAAYEHHVQMDVEE